MKIGAGWARSVACSFLYEKRKGFNIEMRLGEIIRMVVSEKGHQKVTRNARAYKTKSHRHNLNISADHEEESLSARIVGVIKNITSERQIQ